MGKIITLYHGSTEKIEHPALGKGKRNNDYGQGFYCTAHRDLACEWASKLQGLDGYVNQYEIDTAGLKVLDLSKYGILHWMTILLKNRTFTLTTPISIQGKTYLMEHFDIDISSYDIIKGYRADPEVRMPYGINILENAMKHSRQLPMYAEALEERRKARALLLEQLKDYDACLMTGDTNIMHFTGLPSIALPMCMGEDGVPLGIILYGAEERRLLAAALVIQRYCSGSRPPHLA